MDRGHPLPITIRKRGDIINEIIAGNGIGISSVGDSCETLLIYNNHRDYGKKNDGSCTTIKIGQVGAHEYGPDFAISQVTNLYKTTDPFGGGAITDFDGSLATKIELNTGGGSWGISYVSKIKVTYGNIMGTPVVTCVSWECDELNGTKTCDQNKYWITSITGSKKCSPSTYPAGASGCSGPTSPPSSSTSSPMYTVISSNTTASPNSNYAANTSGSAFTLTLPASPSAGDTISIVDVADFTVNNLTVARNGSTIEGYSDDLICDIKGCVYTLIYDGATWELSANLGGDGGTSSS